MRFIYEFLKFIITIGLSIYYAKRTVVNRELLRFDGPAIVVSNHPSTLMDPLNVGALANQQFYFLANAGLFKSAFGNWFFNTFYCIPIQRMQDTDGKQVDNTANFARCDAHMVRGGTLFIAPEGDSWMRRHLLPLKTGTVRIAFNSEAQHDYQLNLKIIPVGLTYSDPTAFRSNVFIKVGTHLYVRDFREAYENAPQEAVKTVTKILQERMRSLMIDTADDEEDLLVKQIETVLENSIPAKPEATFQRTKTLIEALRDWKSRASDDFLVFNNQISSYFKTLQRLKIADESVAKTSNNPPGIQILLLLIGLPIFLYGFANHLFPAFVPFLVAQFLVNRMKLYIGYTTTIKFALGVIMMPLCYWLQSEVVESWFSTKVSWWYLLSLPITGFLAWEYWALFKKIRHQMRLMLSKEKRALQETRRAIQQQALFLLSFQSPSKLSVP